MKKTIKLICLLAVFILFGCFIFSIQNRTVQFQTDENNMPVLSLKADDNIELLHPWLDESSGLYYFFLPSFVSDNRIFCDNLDDGDITINGTALSKWSSFEWEAENTYTLECKGQTYEVAFMKSANLPSLFLETESGDMEYLNADKENEEAGNICIVNPTKNVEYKGNLKKISARGNSTFATNKKAYSITLDKSYALCGLEAGKKWNLLAMYYEYDKIHTKLVYDMADFLDMEYTPGCTWVDLYCNGEYQGLYLLTEAVTVGEGRVEIHDLDKEKDNTSNISGGYLIEREVSERLESGEANFTTDTCNYLFTLKSPKEPSVEELDYIKNYIQNIENLILSGDESYKNYIDMDSFAKQFLIDKIVLNPDAMKMSSFYYKDRNSDILKAGPLWDYDRAFGTSLPDYTASIESYPDSMNDWYMTLYQDEEFYNKLISYYKQLLPFFEDVLNNRIDEYAALISSSVSMDTTLRPILTTQNTMMSYGEYESYVKYLKYFLANRLNYLNELWNISYETFPVPSSTNEYHTVTFIMDDGTILETRQIKDGDFIEDIPALDYTVYSGWQFFQTQKLYSKTIPIYEDITFYAKLKFTTQEERLTYLLEKVKNVSSLQQYLSLIKDDALSVCIYINKNSSIAQDENITTAIKALSAYENPTLDAGILADDNDYFLIVDNGWQSIWESTNGEPLSNLSTTFGWLDYGIDDNENRYLYILDTETNYIEKAENSDIMIIVIKRATGNIEDIATFKDSERIVN